MAKHLAKLSPAVILEKAQKRTAPEDSVQEEMLVVLAGCCWLHLTRY